MHELSIAMGIVNIARKEAVKHHFPGVELIGLETGILSGIEIESLNFVWQINPNIEFLEISSTAGERIDKWYEWLINKIK